MCWSSLFPQKCSSSMYIVDIQQILGKPGNSVDVYLNHILYLPLECDFFAQPRRKEFRWEFQSHVEALGTSLTILSFIRPV